MIDSNKKMSEYEKEWFEKVEKDSTNLFKIAEDALEKDDSLEKIIIVKRLARFDRGSTDLIKIKSELSKFGNAVYDQLWLKRGRPDRIQIVDVNLKCSDSGYLKNLIFGNPDFSNYDGVHLRGKAASRHFTYRAVQAVKPVLGISIRTWKPSPRPHNENPVICGTNCPQQQYQQQKWTNQSSGFGGPSRKHLHQFDSQNTGHENRAYADAVINGQNRKYNVPTSNFWDHLNY